VRELPLSQRLGWLFALAVILPSALLAALAVRSIRREEAFIEKRLAAGLTAEVLQLAASVTDELRRVEEELARGAPGPDLASLRAWKKDSPLVGVPFLLTADYRLAAPKPGQGAAEREFLQRHGEFLAGRQQIPVYTNIALAFQEEILRSDTGDAAPAGAPAVGEGTKEGLSAAPVAASPAASEVPGAPRALKAEAGAPEAEVPETPADTAAGPAAAGLGAEAPAAKKAAADTATESAPAASRARLAQTAQQAVSAFESDREVRRKVYAQAESKGQPPAPRNVNPSAAAEGQRAPESPPPSVFVSEQRRFREIISDRQSGLVPRLIEERLWLLFWMRLPDGRIVGCQLDTEELRARLLALLPPAATPERILTLLDERGGPLFAPAEDSPRDYRRPFVAREVSELLPRWEAAAYLTDPTLVASRARLAGLILWVLVAILTVSITGGGTLVLRALAAEVRLARQKSSFVANVSHELKTPLTSIRMYAEMLQEGRQRDPAKRKQYLGIMVEESRRLTRLVNRVLDFARLERGERRYNFAPLDPEALCRGVLDSEQPRLEQAGFAVSFDPEGWRTGKAELRGDEEALAQVLLNLLSNAEKYSGGPKAIKVELARESGKTRIRVLDRGRGVPPGAVRHLFKEFYRADQSLTNSVQGTGLGLAIARRIVRDHGGELSYLPRAGGGSIFQIELP
jgi:signal transduction histidine kinase